MGTWQFHSFETLELAVNIHQLEYMHGPFSPWEAVSEMEKMPWGVLWESISVRAGRKQV